MYIVNRISGVMVSMLVTSAVDFEPWSGQTKGYKIGICCSSNKNAVLRRKSKDWLIRIRIMCLSGATCLHELLFQLASTIKIQLCWSSIKWISSSSHWKLVLDMIHCIIDNLNHHLYVLFTNIELFPWM